MIPLIIGKNSSGKDQYVDLSTVPLLMISYSSEKQMFEILNRFFKINYEYNSANYLITSSRHMEQIIVEENQLFFLRDIPEKSRFKSRLSLLNSINKEMKRRIKILEGKKVKDFARYVSLNLWNEHKLTYQFMIIDDIWDIVIAKPKTIGLSMMNIILNGPLVGIHTILTSGLSYRNILQQLIQLNPIIREQLRNKYGMPEPQQINVLGTELIFTPDELIFLKKSGEMEMQRFFK
jgi:hypothetical protein